jgi:hypothetical protein
MDAKPGDRVGDDLGGIAEQAKAAVFHLHVSRQRHQAALSDIIFHRRHPSRRRAHGQQLVFTFLQSQVLQMFFRENRLGVAERTDGEDFAFQVGGRVDLRAHHQGKKWSRV